MNKSLKISLRVLSGLLLTLVALLLLFVLLAAPIGKWVVAKYSPSWTGRQITLNHLSVNLFAGRVEIDDIHMYEADGQTDFVTIDSVFVQANLFHLLRREVDLRHIWITNLEAAIIRHDTCFNFSDIIEHFSSSDSVPASPRDTTSSPWSFSLMDIRLHGWQVSYADRQRHSRWALEHLNLDVPGVYFGNRRTEAGLTFDFPNGMGSLGLNGHYNMASGQYALDLDLDSVSLDMAMPFVRDYARVQSLGARLTGCIKARGTLEDILGVELQGHASLSDIDIRDLDAHSLLSAALISAEVDSVNIQDNAYHLGEIRISGLTTAFEQWADHHTFSRLLIEQPAPDSIPMDTLPLDTIGRQPATPLTLSVRAVNVSDVNLTYADHTLASPFTYKISNVRVRAKDFSLQGTNAVSLFASLPEGGSAMVNWRGGMNPRVDNEKLSVILKNVQLHHFSPYLETYVSAPITAGALSLTSENSITDHGMLRGTNNVDIYGMAVGDKDPSIDAPYRSVPVKLAIGILQDMEGKICLGLPVSGNINEPKFSYSRIIWKTIGNVLLKATASPWVALGKALGGNREAELTHMDISLLQPDFTTAQYAQLDAISEMMRSEEDLTLLMTQHFDLSSALTEYAIFLLKREYYEHTYGAITDAMPLLLPSGRTITMPSLADIDNIRAIRENDKSFLAFVARQHPESSGKLSARAMQIYDHSLLEEQVRFMADIRNRSISSYLVRQQGFEPERITVCTADTLTSPQPQYILGAQPLPAFE